jgi:hyaluronoglucosaminidase
VVAGCLLSVAITGAAVACSGDDGGETDGGGSDAEDDDTTNTPAAAAPALATRDDVLPVVTPTPREMRWLGPDPEVPATVVVSVAGTAIDPDLASSTAAISEALGRAGAVDIRVTPAGELASDRQADSDREADAEGGTAAPALTVNVGTIGDHTIAALLREAAVEVPDPLPAEGYALAAFARQDGSGEVVVAGADTAGTFYAAQTLRQLVGAGSVAAVGIVDHPAMGHRGAIEGFYGSPWTHEERLDQLTFYGRFKLNTYIYAPKDDPYHRDRWRDPYPADLVASLAELIEVAVANHVWFTFAVSPGVSICYSDPADVDALVSKLDALYRLGVRSFSIALDDIVHTRWNCDGDRDRYGEPTAEAAARAQVDLLNGLQHGFVAQRDGVRSLQMVPTEYRNTDDSPYRTVLREQLDPDIEVMWTGPMVVPAEITVDGAAAAARVFGRPTYVWDNTPVNDFPATEGRLILAPYDRRQVGLAAEVTGIVLNPMNQAAASKVQLIGAADFTWNDGAYDPRRAQRAAATYLAGGAGAATTPPHRTTSAGADPTSATGADPDTVEALLAFFDVENLAPTSASSGAVAQPQAPVLAGQLDAFRAAWRDGDRTGAIAGLRPYAERLAGAPDLIRANPTDAGFVADCQPWLDATALWGRALVATLDGLDADVAGDAARADAQLARSADLVRQARAIETIPGETRPQGPVRVADGVLDAFLDEAAAL